MSLNFNILDLEIQLLRLASQLPHPKEQKAEII